MEEHLVQHDELRSTRWKSIAIALVVSCLTAIENTVLGVSEFAYLERMDPLASAEFYGAASSIARAGHGLFALIFSLWAYQSQNVKAPLLCGRLISLFACCFYLSVEYFPSDRRFVMGSCYLFFDIATSAPTVLRVYMIAVSSRSDRPRAYAALTLSNWIAVVIGPVFQLVFSSVSYPGLAIIPGLRFHIFSAPVWLALFMNFLSIYLICRCLDNPPYPNDAPKFSVAVLLDKVAVLPRLDIRYGQVALCWLLRVVSNTGVVTLMTLTAPLLMVVFGYSGEETVFANSVASTFVGFFALTICSILMFTSLTKRISPFAFFAGSLAIGLLMYLTTYPYSGISSHLSPYNATTGAGCQSTKYPWCDTALASNANLFLAMAAVQTGIGLPVAQISLDTVYSNVLGETVDQNLMQGAFVAFEDFIYAIGPVYYAKAFTYYGQSVIWILNFLVLLLTMPILCPFYRNYNTN